VQRCFKCGNPLVSIETETCLRCQDSSFQAQPRFLKSLLWIPLGLFKVYTAPHLRKLALWPLLISSLALLLLLYLGLNFVFQNLNLWLTQSFTQTAWTQALQGMLVLFTGLALSLFFLYLFLPVSALICIPFLDALALQFEEDLLGPQKTPPPAPSLAFMLKEIFRLLCFKTLVLLLVLPLLLIPIVGPLLFLIPITLLTALDLLDMILARKSYPLQEKLQFFKNNFASFCLFSIPLLLIGWVPFLQLILLPGASAGALLFYLNCPSKFQARKAE